MAHTTLLARIGIAAVFLAAGVLGCGYDNAVDDLGTSPRNDRRPEPTRALPPEDTSAQEKISLDPLPPGSLKPFTHVRLSDRVYFQVLQDEETAITDMLSSALTQAGTISALGGPATAAQRRVFLWQPYWGGSKRRVVVHAEVCLQKGFLEHLLSFPDKNHESVLEAEFDSYALHAGLEAAGAKRGKPVRFVDEHGRDWYRPPTGDEIRILVRYQDDAGDFVTRPAQQWIMHRKSKKILQKHWVFAGSYTYKHEGKEYYAAQGSMRVICVANFAEALLDVPMKSSEREEDGIEFVCNTELIPPIGTKVQVILEPIPKN